MSALPQPAGSPGSPVVLPTATLALAAGLVGVFLVQLAVSSTGAPGLVRDLGVAPDRVGAEAWRLLSGTFLHLSWAHVMLNVAGLLVLGPPLERRIGRRGLLTLWVATAAGAGTLSCLATASGVSAGASGVVVGMMAAAMVVDVHPRPTGIAFRLLVGALLVVNLAGGFAIPGVDGWAHVGGAISGVAAGWALSVQPGGFRWRRTTDGLFWLSVVALGWTGVAAVSI